MPMSNKDKPTVDEIYAAMTQALNNDDKDAFLRCHQQLTQALREELLAEQRSQAAANQTAADQAALLARGQRVLTSAEQKYYEDLIQAMKDSNPKQALSNLVGTMPETILEDVFTDLRTRHPLLSKIRFLPTGAVTKLILSTSGHDAAVWGELFAPLSKEINAGFKVVTTNLCKLSAWLPVPKDGITFGPVWLDRYVRETLYEAYANGFEAAIVDGTGKDQPIGMTRQVGEGVTVTDGVYPRKTKIKVTRLDLESEGGLIGLMTTDADGKERDVRELILVCNVNDYFTRVMAATHIQNPDGTYRQALAFPAEIIPVANGLKRGEAILGLGYRYFGTVGGNQDGNIDYSDHYKFLEDIRAYLIKGYGNGFPMDNNAFLFLDISDLQPMVYRVQTSEPTPSSDATLTSLKIGALTLSPTFASGTTSYTASTTNAKNVINALPANANAQIAITVGGEPVDNGTPITWAAGSNTVQVVVTAEDGTTIKTYTVTVTKS